ncbi:MAG: hypothetical protein WCF16_00045 [Alphaproteobacteria bacterium]
MASGQTRLAVKIRPPESGRAQVTYAAAFIHPAIVAVDAADDGWDFTVAEPVDRAILESGLRALIERFRTPPPPSPAPEFRLEPPRGFGDKRALGDLKARGAMQEIARGLFVFREPVSTLLRFLDAAILARFAAPFSAREETYPNCIPVADLGRADHLASFPEHLHFLTHLTQDLALLDRFAARARDQGAAVAPSRDETAAVELVQNPSTCYHCYAARRGSEVPENLALTALAKCHRFEAANHRDTGRLLEFSLREVIFLGDGAFMRASRARTVDLMTALAQDWRLYGELVAANDPFFTSDYEIKAAHQRRMAMKMEYRAALPGEAATLAVMSSNLHGVSFGKAFDITRAGRPIQTGCLGFGHERLALALIAQHGIEAEHWPARLREEFTAWQTNDPIARTT